ncbi:DUF5112 domain-containing protein [Bacteroides sp. 519]|uniref:DUF5112 domain-containing protein n=1 Tax=Bacteroides sp. 519 TaxID=2302937 RepID=UPI0013D8956B|nr:DUF5112 domain-containing protein [Bacteroides sp. 519]NDV59636.1 DUF5112 domain-containing protein [Bacteroides sp. 519]
MRHCFLIIVIPLLFISFLVSCIGTAPTKEVQLIDSLNRRAYNYRYKDLEKTFESAWIAYEEANLYTTGKAEACNNLGFYAFMQMNFDRAEQFFREVYNLTQNELELLIADVGLMKIYQRTAMNKEFYDYRNNAIQRIKRIDEDRSLFIETNEKKRLNFALTEFSIVSAIYYYYLQQVPEALMSINEIKPDIELVNDTSQILYYHYIKGSASLTGESTPDGRRLAEFDELFKTWRLASQGDYLYFEGNGLQGLANLMISPDNLRLFMNRRSHALSQFGLPVDSLLPLELARKALAKFQQYNDIYQIAGAYVSIGRYLNERGYHQEALDTLVKSLECVNTHHRMYYTDIHNKLDGLKPYVEKDTIYTETTWMAGEKFTVKTVPEWISRIREQLSVAYAGLGMKPQSDYNRDIYLEILKITRQNKELESRFLLLQQESHQLNFLLLFVLVGFILLIILFWIFNKHSQKRNREHTARLELTLDICQKVTSSIPSDVEDEEDMVNEICASILPDMNKLLGAQNVSIRLPDAPIPVADEANNAISSFSLYVPDKEEPLGVFVIATDRVLSKDDQALVNIITPYIAWSIDNGMTLLSLGDERERLEKEKYIYEQHIARSKRENIIKKACLAIVNGIVPYIDRIINEIYKLREKGFIHNKEVKTEKYQYIDELVTTINEYNDILALWIKMKQGTLSLNVENFALEELFDLVKKGRKTFEMKQQSFTIRPTEAIIKADKALTLFMINTLTENARKYTQEGGEVKVYAHTTEEYVEISVEDNGRGLSPEDVALIKDEKVYDSRMIGISDEKAEDLKKLKGSGFGLMNCKGIIEKYKKTNKLFHVCLFSVESRLGKGSRFFFRLPLGVRKNLMLWLGIFMMFGFSSCHKQNQPTKIPALDSLTLAESIEYDRLLTQASLYADTAYYCNVIEEYEMALTYIDSSMTYLNKHYKQYSSKQLAYMSLNDNDIPAELIWWDQPFTSDYNLISDMRNIAAVSFLSLKQWEAYTYNNKAHTAVYKLLHEDQSLEAFCLELERSTGNKIVAIILCALLLIAYFIGYYAFYMRKRLLERWNLEQVLDINKQIFSSSIIRTEDSLEALQREENALKEIPWKIVKEGFEPINELIEINTLGLAVYNEAKNRLEFSSNPDLEDIPPIVQHCFHDKVHISEGKFQAFPLIVDASGKHQCVGVLYLERQEVIEKETDRLLFELIARYVATVVFNAVVKLAMRYRDIESAYEDTHRASWEDSMLHVQNMVLDNCLSTIKHETIYYPNKIKQIINKLSEEGITEEKEKEYIETINELIDYYKGIFTILSSCASRQLEEVTFRRSTIKTDDLLMYATKYFKKQLKAKKINVTLNINSGLKDVSVVGDLNQLYFLFENLINEALSYPSDGELIIHTLLENNFVKFLFTDTRRNKTTEELNNLFYPDLARMAGNTGELKETEYLICKQIIRDHDEYASRRGCRINAEPATDGGFTVYFTIPKR